MAKEVDLKKVELKVAANCCYGCRRKVQKALRRIEGVLKIEIDSSQPKVTVLGNVDPRILIKKLLKIRKHAEILSYQNPDPVEEKIEEKEKTKPGRVENSNPEHERKTTPNHGKEKKEDRSLLTEEKEKAKSRCVGKPNASCEYTSAKNKEFKVSGHGEVHLEKVSQKDQKERITIPNTCDVPEYGNPIPPLTEVRSPDMQQKMSYGTENFHSSAQHYYMAKPYASPIPYYAMPSPSYYIQPCYYGERPAYQTPFHASMTRVGVILAMIMPSDATLCESYNSFSEAKVPEENGINIS